MRTKNIDLSLLLLGVVLILVSSYQLFFHQGFSLQAPAVGTLSHMSAVVKTKGALTLDWQDARPNHPIAANQLIYTDQSSSAEVSFLQGDQLLIGENSLVKITGPHSSLDLERGIIRAKLQGDSPLHIELNGDEFQLSGQGAEVQISLTDEQGEIGVLAGDVVVAKEGFSENLNSSKALTIEGSEIKTQDIYFQTSSPERESIIYTDTATTSINFAWSPAEEARIFIATNPQMKRARELKSPALLPAGHYYWRVEGEQGRSLVSSFKLIREVAPEIIRPKNGEQLELKVEVDQAAEVRLQWQGSPQERYMVEWEGEMIPANGTTLLVPAPVAGNYSWRVRIDDAARPLAQWSELQQVTVTLVPPPVTPVNLKPDGVEYQSYQRSGEKIEMSWNSSTDVEWELLHPNGQTESKLISGSSVTVTITDSGSYRWRVRARDQFSRISSWSEWKSFEFSDLSQMEFTAEVQRIQLKRPDQMVSFEWTAESGTVTKFELARDPRFEEIIYTREVRGPSTKATVPEVGTYYWRSRQFLPNGTVNSSEPVKVIIEPAPAPQKPEKPTDVEVPIEWQLKKTSWHVLDLFISRAHADDLRGVAQVQLPKNEDAKAIHLRIFRDAALQELVVDEVVQGEFFIWEGVRPGTYYWQYAWVDFWDRESPFSDPAVMRLTGEEVKPLERPRLRAPIRAREVEAKKLEFQWTAPMGANKYQLKVAESRDFSKVLYTTNTSRSRYKAQHWKLDPGLYFWRVTAFNKYGQSVQSNTGRFIIPKLERIIIAEPPARWQKIWRPRAAISWSPSMDNYEFEQAGQSGKIDGNALMGVELKGSYFTDRWALNGELLRQSGEVFEGQEYLFQRLITDAGYRWHNFTLGLGLGLSSGQEYSIENDSVTAKSVSGLNYGPVVRSYHALNPQWEIQGKLFYLLGEVKQMELGGEVLRWWGKDYFFSVGGSYALREYETNAGEQSSLRFSLGLGKEF